ncbi:MAG: 50S ribosomal protein L25 [Bacteroidota bacterium]|nr:50S ribosomal protein L25 [Bacteroidota bacterium]MDP3145328.1 50S ribosomal protein L25 [Bacteroidota bacterium]MDP3557603.1 50S ribosomal protein L25 [Bacteroidota bacterium]
MKTVSLSGSLRANVGKVDATAVRAKGHVPCVIYGAGEQIHFSTDIRNFKNIIFTPETSLVEIDVDGKKYKTVLQETQYHKINDKLIHADFLMVSEDKPVSVHLPVKAIGQSEGVKAGGKLTIKLRKLKVKGLISKLPESIDLSIDKLVIGKSISVGDINIDGITVLHPKNISVISVDTTRAVVVEEPAKVATTAATPAAAAKTAAPKK